MRNSQNIVILASASLIILLGLQNKSEAQKFEPVSKAVEADTNNSAVVRTPQRDYRDDRAGELHTGDWYAASVVESAEIPNDTEMPDNGYAASTDYAFSGATLIEYRNQVSANVYANTGSRASRGEALLNTSASGSGYAASSASGVFDIAGSRSMQMVATLDLSAQKAKVDECGASGGRIEGSLTRGNQIIAYFMLQPHDDGDTYTFFLSKNGMSSTQTFDAELEDKTIELGTFKVKDNDRVSVYLHAYGGSSAKANANCANTERTTDVEAELKLVVRTSQVIGSDPNSSGN